MNLSESSSNKPLDQQDPPQPQNKRPRVARSTIVASIFLLFSLVGFMDAGYLSFKHMRHEVPTCTIIKGCDVVTTSAYSSILGIPVAYLGTLYYLSILFLAIVYIDKKNPMALALASRLTIAGLLASAWFVYLQLFILNAICVYCMGSALSSTILFVTGVWYMKKR